MRFAPLRTTAVVLLATAALAAPAAATPAAAGPAATASIELDGDSAGRTFDGVGGVSAGGSSRLLLDYPPAERGQILDYLFKPGYGASLQILKVEIGGDTDATDGPEPSIERTRGAVDCDRGYEWWLMAQAQQRNPNIEFYGLEWGAPGWLDGGRWSDDNVSYTVAWLDCARQHGFHIDYLGGANESGYDKTYYEHLHDAVRAAGYDAKIVASDDHNPPNYWAVATDMAADPAFDDAVDVVGEHDICVWRTLYQHCNVNDDALGLNKPLFNSETSTQAFDVGPGPLARAMNRDYLDARVTGNLDWALLSGWYADFPIADTGLLEADQPWSGYYRIGAGIWVDAQTTQFTEPGWRYLDDSSGYLDDGASYVTLRAPDTGDYSTVIETMDAAAPITVDFSVAGGLSDGTVHEWSTDLGTATGSDDFVHDRDLPGGSYSVTLQPHHVYTLSTVAGAHKGTAASHADPAARLPLPYSQNFEHPDSADLAPYFSDDNGAFEAVPCGGGRAGTCYQQQITRAPIAWHGTAERPASLVGDPSWWGDYQVGVDAMLDQAGQVQLVGRAESQQHRVASYRLQFADTGDWTLYTEDVAGNDTTLASGTGSFGVGQWHRLALRFHGDQITAMLDGRVLARVHDGSHTSGQVGVATGGWQKAEFDNLTVTPTGPAPRFVPHSTMSVTASSAHDANDFGDSYGAGRAIDDRPESYWRSEYDPATPLPQSITLDLHQTRTVRALTYKPPLANASTGTILGYQVSLSDDGRHFHQVASGTWAPTVATKVANWPGAPTARYVRLTALSATGCPASASVAELNVSTTPVTDFPTSGDPGTSPTQPPSQFDNVVPDSELTATASSHHDGYEPANAIDGDCATMWHSEWSPVDTAPQDLTIDLAQPRTVDGFSYQPRQDGNGNGVVTRYQIDVSDDGTGWQTAATGSWASDSTTKYVTFSPTPAAHVRLTVLAGGGGYASAAEVGIAYVP